jgi:hypothetical protein
MLAASKKKLSHDLAAPGHKPDAAAQTRQQRQGTRRAPSCADI